MLGGGHVRRGSVDTQIGGSPLARLGMEKRKQTLQKIARVLTFDQWEDIPPPPPSLPKSPPPSAVNKSPLALKPSIASTSSLQFGEERMIKAKQGLLERQSLEESALVAQGAEILTNCKPS